MKEVKVLESNVTVLKTPIIDIEIVDENDKNIPFDIVESWNPIHTTYLDNDVNNIVEVTDYDEKQIRIDTSNLEIGKTYFVKTSKPIEYRDSDEHLFTYGYTEDTQTFAISFPDPHDDFKDFPQYCKDDYRMKWYDFNGEMPSDKKAVSFYLIDHEKEFIYIATAWIWNIHDHMIDYETAAEVFTWIVQILLNRLLYKE